MIQDETQRQSFYEKMKAIGGKATLSKSHTTVIPKKRPNMKKGKSV